MSVVSLTSSQAAVPVSDLIAGDETVGATIESVKTSERVGRVETVTLTGVWADANPARIVGRPVSFTWGPQYRRETFHGYVTKAGKPQQFKQQTEVEIVCTGPARALQRSRGPRFWSGVTLDSVVSSLAHRSGLGASVDPHWMTFRRLAQTVESDWAFLVALGKHVGFETSSRRGVVRMFSPPSAITQAPRVMVQKVTSDLEPGLGLLDFTPVVSVDEVQEPATAAFFQPDGTVGLTDPDSETFEAEYLPDTDNVRRYTERAASYHGWTDLAQARIRGDLSVTVGSTILIRTGMSSTVVDKNDGVWLVTGVSHQLDRERFQTQLLLIRDHQRFTDVASDTTSGGQFWSGRNRSQPYTRLVGGRWVSSWRR